MGVGDSCRRLMAKKGVSSAYGNTAPKIYLCVLRKYHSRGLMKSRKNWALDWNLTSSVRHKAYISYYFSKHTFYNETDLHSS
jgi:hypothetical protein